MRPNLKFVILAALFPLLSLSGCSYLSNAPEKPQSFIEVGEDPNTFCPTNVLVNKAIFAKNDHKSRTVTLQFVSLPDAVTLYPGERRRIGCKIDPVTKREANYAVTKVTFVDVIYGSTKLNEGVIASRNNIDAKNGFGNCKVGAPAVNEDGIIHCPQDSNEKPWWKVW